MLFNLPEDVINLIMDKVFEMDPTFIFQIPQVWFRKYLNYKNGELDLKIFKCLNESKIHICNLII